MEYKEVIVAAARIGAIGGFKRLCMLLMLRITDFSRRFPGAPAIEPNRLQSFAISLLVKLSREKTILETI